MSGKEESAKHVQNTSVFAMVLCLLSLVLKIISAIMGKTALQITDAARCLAETTVVVIWWYICSVKKMDIGNEWQNRFNRTVRYAMICSSVLMAAFALLRYLSAQEESGSLYLGMLVSSIGTVTNFTISHRYKKNAAGDKAVRKQSVLFCIKSFADASVALTLGLTTAFPDRPFTVYCRLFTSLAVSVAMALGGTLRN